MPSPRKGEPQKKYISRCMSCKEAQKSFPDQSQRVAFCHSQWGNKGKSSGAIFIYEDPKTGELFHFRRRKTYRKNGRTLVFVTKAEGETIPDHILNRTEESYSDEKAGCPPNCNKGYIEKNGKCVSEQEKD